MEGSLDGGGRAGRQIVQVEKEDRIWDSRGNIQKTGRMVLPIWISNEAEPDVWLVLFRVTKKLSCIDSMTYIIYCTSSLVIYKID